MVILDAYTYGDLFIEVQKFANVLKSLGVTKGDRVTIYLPMVPELPIAMLACARIGAIHTVIFLDSVLHLLKIGLKIPNLKL